MNRVSLRALSVGAEPTLHGTTGWAHRPAHEPPETPWTVAADAGTRGACTTQDVTVRLGGDDLKLAVTWVKAWLAAQRAPDPRCGARYQFRKGSDDQTEGTPASERPTRGSG